MEILKVKATSVPNSVAGALAGVIREHEQQKFKLLVQVH